MEGAGGRVSALIDVRGKVFEECLDSICELIVTTSYCGRMLEKGKRMREIRNIENMVRIYVESEREVFLSYLMQFCNVKDQKEVKCEYESLRRQIVAAMIRPSKARKMSTRTLMMTNCSSPSSRGPPLLHQPLHKRHGTQSPPSSPSLVASCSPSLSHTPQFLP